MEKRNPGMGIRLPLIHHSITPRFHYSTIGYPNARTMARPHPNPTYESTPYIRHERIARGRSFVIPIEGFRRRN
jgi:hypothetical protein